MITHQPFEGHWHAKLDVYENIEMRFTLDEEWKQYCVLDDLCHDSTTFYSQQGTKRRPDLMATLNSAEVHLTS